MNKVKDTFFHLSGLYKIYGKRLENEIRDGDIPNHVALILDGKQKMGKKTSDNAQRRALGRELMQ